jgi:hypothetical protein
VRKNGVINAGDSTFAQMAFELPERKNDLMRNDLIVLNVIASNAAKGWARPIYFTNPYGELGFGQYLRKEGLSYRLVPVKNNFPQQAWVVDQALQQNRLGGTAIRDNNTGVMFKALMNEFRTGGASKSGVYLDEENRRNLLSVRATYGEAAGNMADAGQKAEAVQLLQKAEAAISTENLPYAMTSRYNSHNQTALIYLEAAYKAGNTTLANTLKTSINKDLQDQKAYYNYLKSEREELFRSMEQEALINDLMITVFETVVRSYEQKTPVVENPAGAAPAATDSTNR